MSTVPGEDTGLDREASAEDGAGRWTADEPGQAVGGR